MRTILGILGAVGVGMTVLGIVVNHKKRKQHGVEEIENAATA